MNLKIIKLLIISNIISIFSLIVENQNTYSNSTTLNKEEYFFNDMSEEEFIK